MAGSSGSDDEDEITGINVTPLVDVMLVLLVIFMVTASYIVHRSININLPKAATADSALSSKNLAFALDREGVLYLDGNVIEYDRLKSLIEQVRLAAGSDVSLQALITADAETSHGNVVKLIDAVRKNGINDFAINVEVEHAQVHTEDPAGKTDIEQ